MDPSSLSLFKQVPSCSESHEATYKVLVFFKNFKVISLSKGFFRVFHKTFSLSTGDAIRTVFDQTKIYIKNSNFGFTVCVSYYAACLTSWVSKFTEVGEVDTLIFAGL